MTAASTPALLSPLDGYDRWAATYDRTPNPLLALEHRVLTPLIPCVVGRRVLDLGCGTGRWLARMVSVGADAVGVDFSPAMLAEAARKPNLRDRLIHADLSRLPLPDASFDLVLCSFVLEHCRDLDAIAREVGRVSKSVASVFITQLHPDAARRGWACGFQDDRGRAEIASSPHPLDALIQSFSAFGFDLARHVHPTIGEPERDFFIASGREDLFAASCSRPAILVCEFRRGQP